jgi:hypothetical protein
MENNWIDGDLWTMTEDQLVYIAEQCTDDVRADMAMVVLREKFDKTYFWCSDCDFLVTKHSECCLNRKTEENEQRRLRKDTSDGSDLS